MNNTTKGQPMTKNQAALKAVNAVCLELQDRGDTYRKCVRVSENAHVPGCFGFEFQALTPAGGVYGVWAYTRVNGEVAVY